MNRISLFRYGQSMTFCSNSFFTDKNISVKSWWYMSRSKTTQGATRADVRITMMKTNKRMIILPWSYSWWPLSQLFSDKLTWSCKQWNIYTIRAAESISVISTMSVIIFSRPGQSHFHRQNSGRAVAFKDFHTWNVADSRYSNLTLHTYGFHYFNLRSSNYRFWKNSKC